MEITVKIKNVYGIDRTYPVCDTAMLLAQLTGRVTFTAEHITIIKFLGYSVKVEQANI